jgi:hypothetical protein
MAPIAVTAASFKPSESCFYEDVSSLDLPAPFDGVRSIMQESESCVFAGRVLFLDCFDAGQRDPSARPRRHSAPELLF